MRPAELSPLSTFPAGTEVEPAGEPVPEMVEVLPPNVALCAEYARVPTERPRWLSLVVDAVAVIPADDAEEDVAAEPETEPPAIPSFAAGLDAMVGGLFDSPASLASLLQAANEHRRIVDLLWAAHEIGAVSLPSALAERIERARQAWPSVLPGSAALAPA